MVRVAPLKKEHSISEQKFSVNQYMITETCGEKCGYEETKFVNLVILEQIIILIRALKLNCYMDITLEIRMTILLLIIHAHSEKLLVNFL